MTSLWTIPIMFSVVWVGPRWDLGIGRFFLKLLRGFQCAEVSHVNNKGKEAQALSRCLQLVLFSVRMVHLSREREFFLKQNKFWWILQTAGLQILLSGLSRGDKALERKSKAFSEQGVKADNNVVPCSSKL